MKKRKMKICGKRILVSMFMLIVMLFAMTACGSKLRDQAVSKEDIKELVVQGISYSDLNIKDVDKENKTAKVEIVYPDIINIVKKNPLILMDKSKLKMEMAKTENRTREEIEVKVTEQDGKWTVDTSIDQNENIEKIVEQILKQVIATQEEK